jgi:hypothetical protein
MDTGPLCEGRVAGALWDLLDKEDDGFDTYSTPFYVIDSAMDKN